MAQHSLLEHLVAFNGNEFERLGYEGPLQEFDFDDDGVWGLDTFLAAWTKDIADDYLAPEDWNRLYHEALGFATETHAVKVFVCHSDEPAQLDHIEEGILIPGIVHTGSTWHPLSWAQLSSPPSHEQCAVCANLNGVTDCPCCAPSHWVPSDVAVQDNGASVSPIDLAKLGRTPRFDIAKDCFRVDGEQMDPWESVVVEDGSFGLVEFLDEHHRVTLAPLDPEEHPVPRPGLWTAHEGFAVGTLAVIPISAPEHAEPFGDYVAWRQVGRSGE